MNLDEELRGALTREADRRTPPPPDVVGMISGGRARRGRRTTVRIAGTAVVAVLVGCAAYGVTLADPFSPRTGDIAPAGTPADSTAPAPLPDSGTLLESRVTYRLPVGTDATGEAIEADLSVEGVNWAVSGFPVLNDLWATFAGIGVYQPSALAGGRGCLNDPITSDLGETPRDLADRLATLPRSAVLEAPGPTQVSGRDAVHLRLRVDVDCRQYYRVAESPRGDRGITYAGSGANPPSVVIDFWVLDIDGARVVIDQWHDSDAPREQVDRATAARQSITFVEE
jgi:hypothetical protein